MLPNLLLRLELQLQILQDLEKELPADWWQQRPIPDKWSIQAHLSHLGRYHEIFQNRLLRILEEKEVELGRYRHEEDPEATVWFDKSIPQLFTDLNIQRAALLQILQELDTSQWQLRGHHPKLGWLTVRDWVEFFLLHENHHLYAIFKLRHLIKNYFENGTT